VLGVDVRGGRGLSLFGVEGPKIGDRQRRQAVRPTTFWGGTGSLSYRNQGKVNRRNTKNQRNGKGVSELGLRTVINIDSRKLYTATQAVNVLLIFLLLQHSNLQQ
jgi:hypothetical protein